MPFDRFMAILGASKRLEFLKFDTNLFFFLKPEQLEPISYQPLQAIRGLSLTDRKEHLNSQLKEKIESRNEVYRTIGFAFPNLDKLTVLSVYANQDQFRANLHAAVGQYLNQHVQLEFVKLSTFNEKLCTI